MHKLLSVLLLATGMLLATTMTLKASWLWVLAPIALLFVLDAMGGVAGKVERAAIPFYAALLVMALAFHFFGPSTAAPKPKVAAGAHTGCGAGGCGSAGGCSAGIGGCSAGTGGACGCGSRKTSKSVATSTNANAKASSPSSGNRPGAAPNLASVRPVTPTPPKRKFNVQLPPPPSLPPSQTLPPQPQAQSQSPAPDNAKASPPSGR